MTRIARCASLAEVRHNINWLALAALHPPSLQPN
jgi:hypothetical protein